jgi:hypothetical protein
LATPCKLRKFKSNADTDEVENMVLDKMIFAELPEDRQLQDPLLAIRMAFYAGGRVGALVKDACTKLKGSPELAALDSAMKQHRSNPNAWMDKLVGPGPSTE